MTKSVPASAEYESLGKVAQLLGKSKAYVKKAVDRGLLRSSTAPFKSNLNPGHSSHMVLVNLQDVRDALAGKIDLTSLDAIQVARKDLPENMTEFAERFVNLEQSVEQLCTLCAHILETLNTGHKPAPKSKREVPDSV